MRTSVGLALVGISLFGIFISLNVSEETLPSPYLWLTGFVVLGLIGIRTIVVSSQKLEKTIQQNLNERVEQMKKDAEQATIDFDSCEFKSGLYFQQVKDENMKTVELFAQSDTFETNKIEQVVSAYLVYTNKKNGRTYISQSFPVDSVTLKYYVLNSNLVLYINRSNDKEYLFDLKS